MPFVSRGRVLVIDPTWELAWAEEELRDANVAVEAAERPEGDDVVGLLVSPDVPVGRPELARLPRLEAVATNATGFDHLDVQALADAGVWCSNIAGYCTEEVAEHAIAMVIGLLRGVTELDRDVRAGSWDVFHRPPRRVAGACLGVVGFGRIGRAVAWRARALGMQVVVCDTLVADEDIRAEGVEPVVLGDLLARADVVTLHAPLDGTTRSIMDAAAIGRMKPGAFLVNCARGDLVDHEALGRRARVRPPRRRRARRAAERAARGATSPRWRFRARSSIPTPRGTRTRRSRSATRCRRVISLAP